MTPVNRMRKLRHVTVETVPLRSLVLALFLLLGVCSGYLATGRFAPGGDELSAFLDAYLLRAAASKPDAETVLRTLVCFFRSSVAAFLLGFSSVGVFCLPLLAAIQGFVLSFSLFSFAEAIGQGGFLLLAALFGVRLLFVLPCTFLLGSAAMERSWAMLSLVGGKRTRIAPAGFSRFALCCLCLLLGCALELWLVPLFLRGGI